MIAQTPKPPYNAVIFNLVEIISDKEYSEISEAMVRSVQQRSGFLGFETIRNDMSITVSYWENIDSILNLKNHEEHQKI
jgi:heme-degrading monooxygenase HmoA